MTIFMYAAAAKMGGSENECADSNSISFHARFAFDQLSGWEPETNLVPLTFNEWKDKQ